MLLVPYLPLISRIFATHDQGRDVEETAVATSYKLQTIWRGNDFYSGFDFFTADDPTHGRVNYVDEATAKSKNLTQATGHTFYMRADHTNKVAASALGRDSVRIQSKNTYSDGMAVLDVVHMPVGCGTWPAFWTSTAQNWPVGGEIDIIRGVNGMGDNLMSLHTSSGCTMPTGNRAETGTELSNNCVSGSGDNTGCNVQDTRASSFGAAFNTGKGGYYVMRRDASRGIAIWFFPRQLSTIPTAIKNGAKTISESALGEPVANFPNSASCDINSHFGPHQIIFDITFCGDWAGSAWSTSSCKSKAATCEEYVNNHPNAYSGAYWQINALRWYNKA